jgi:hypothetical protein
MMQLDQQSRWQSWMRMLAVGIRAVDEPARSIDFTKWGVSDWRYLAIDGSTSIAARRLEFCHRHRLFVDGGTVQV